jgi:hypothetical protein
MRLLGERGRVGTGAAVVGSWRGGAAVVETGSSVVDSSGAAAVVVVVVVSSMCGRSPDGRA